MPSVATRRRRFDAAQERNADEERGFAAATSSSSSATLMPSRNGASPYALNRPTAEGEKMNPLLRLLVNFPGIPILALVFAIYYFVFRK